jgi:hypothetical protein
MRVSLDGAKLALRHARKIKTSPKVSFDVVKNSIQTQGSWVGVLNDYAVRWDRVSAKALQSARDLPQRSRSLIELQMVTNQLHAETEIVSRVGETAASTVKRLQQSSAN